MCRPAKDPLANDPRAKAKHDPVGFISGKIRAYFKQYGALKIASLVMSAYIALISYCDPDVGYIIDAASPERTAEGVILTRTVERAIVAVNDWQMVCLGIARVSAFFMYPSLVFVFLTKFRATMEFVSHTPLSLFSYSDLHELHVYCGWIILIHGLIHTLFHIFRWGNQGNLNLLIDHFSGISGVIMAICLVLVCVPMCILPVKKRISYETRKYMHYFFVVLCLAFCFHSTTTSVPNGGFSKYIFSVLLAWYFLDSIYVYLFMTEKIESTVFHVVPTGVQLTMTVSKRFQRGSNSGGYCYVCFPWINKWQWHAFSLFENPLDPTERQIYIQKLGDWTNKVCEALQRDTVRPVWVQGPFSSPYDRAVNFDNQILVAGGIGITPAISVMRAHKDTRRTNLIWAVRDPHMLEFFLKHGEFSSRGWNLVFYTGKDPLPFGEAKDIITSSGATVHIIRARPDFAKLVPNIIYSIESGTFVPESFVSDKKMEAIIDLSDKLIELDEDMEMTSQEKLDELINCADSFGYLFTDIASAAASSLADNDEANGMARTAEEGKVKKISKDDFKDEEELAPLRGSSTVGASTDILDTFRNAYLLSKFADGKPTQRRGSRQSVTRGSQPSAAFGGSVVRGRRQSSMFSKTWNAVNTEMTKTHSVHALQNSFKPWEADSVDPKKYVDSLDKKAVLETWGVLYCGGKGPLAESVHKVSKEYGINISLESFAW